MYNIESLITLIVNMRNKIVVIVFATLVANFGFSQRRPKTMNYRKFDKHWVHFGFMLGLNTADFSTQYNANMLSNYGVYSVQNKKQPGFDLGLIGSVKLGTPLLWFRFIPSLSFQERVLTYQFAPTEPNAKMETYEERVQSTNLDFPMLIKFRTLRYNNFDAYLIGGVQYTLDLQSKANKVQKYSDPFIKIDRDDWQGQVGAGVDFFLPFFKFGIELKFSHSFNNVLIQDHTTLSNPINRLYNRVWWISFTFEG